MADFAKVAHKFYIGAAADIKPTGIEIGAECLEYDTDKTFITYDGDNWVETDTFIGFP